jgi:Tol biopolymer transport system component
VRRRLAAALFTSLALVAGLVAACAGGGTPPSTTVVPAGPGERHLTNIRQLTFGGNNAEAYWSADGKRIIFQRQPDITKGCDQMYVMNADGSQMRHVANGLGKNTCGYFYANDTRIVYASTFTHDSACPAPPDYSRGYVWPLSRYELFTAKADGSDLTQMTDNGLYNAEATLSPDGKRVIFTSTRDGDLELYTMNVDGSDVRRLTHRVGYDGGAFFSPDGTKIVWRAGYPVTAADTADYQSLLAARMVRPSRMNIWIANADGTEPRQVTQLAGASFAPFFTRDGKRIIFSTNQADPRSRNFDLYLVNLDGTGLEQVTTDPDFDAFPMFDPTGRKLIWASNRHAANPGETNLFVADWTD